jgi:hypothetical protein
MRHCVSVKRDSQYRRLVLGAALAALGALLIACPATFPLTITDISASPDPIVGKVVTLEVEIQSTEDEADVTSLIQLPEAIRLIDGDLTWHGSLRARERYTHKVSVCALYEGDWRIGATTYSRFAPDDTYGDYQTIHFISTSHTGQAIPGSRYTIVQGTRTVVLTPPPVPTPATCQ